MADIKFTTETGDNIEVNTTDRHSGEGLNELELELDTKHGFGLTYLNKQEAKALSDSIREWCEG